MKVIAFTGLPGSGKSEAVGVAEEAGFNIIRMGDEVRAEAERRGMPINDKNLGEVANEMREREGMDVWARRCLKKLKEIMAGEFEGTATAGAADGEGREKRGGKKRGKRNGKRSGITVGTAGAAGVAIKDMVKDMIMDVIIIDGIRNIEEVETFRQSMKDFILIAVHASPKTRYERMMKRGREDDSLSIDDLKKRDERELAWGIGNVVAMADIVVTNEGSLEEFRKKVKKLLDEIVQS